MSHAGNELTQSYDRPYGARIGSIILENLIANGTLPSHLDFRLQNLPPNERDASFEQAVKIALGIEDGEMPAWTLPDNPLPDVLWVHPARSAEERKEMFQDLDQMYYSVYSLRKVLVGSEEAGLAWRSRVEGVAFRIWSRLLEHTHPPSKERIDFLRTIPSQAVADTLNISLKYAKRVAVCSKYIGDDLLFELISNNLIGLRSYMKGIGPLAVNGIGTMLFMSGEHPELGSYAEALENYVEQHSRSTN